MNNPLFAPGSALGNAFNDIFKTDSHETKTNEHVDAAQPTNTPASDNKPSATVDVA